MKERFLPPLSWICCEVRSPFSYLGLVVGGLVASFTRSHRAKVAFKAGLALFRAFSHFKSRK